MQVPLSGLKILSDCYTHKLPTKYLPHFHKKMGAKCPNITGITLPFIDLYLFKRQINFKKTTTKTIGYSVVVSFLDLFFYHTDHA